MRSLPSIALLLAVALGLCGVGGCSMVVDYRDSDALSEVGACLRLASEPVSFLTVDLGDMSEETLVLENLCEQTLQFDLTWKQVEGDVSSFVLVDDVNPIVLQPGRLDLLLRFAPSAPGNHVVSLAFLQDDDTVLGHVRLNGYGNGSALELNPPNLHIDVGSVGCEYDGVLQVGNSGNGPLTVFELFVDPVKDPLRVDIGDLGPGPWVLGPQQSLELMVHYRPLDAATDRVEVNLLTDAMGSERVIVELLGTAASAGHAQDVMKQEPAHVSQVVAFFQRDLAAKNPEALLDDLTLGLRGVFEELKAGQRITVISAADGCAVGGALYVDDLTPLGDVRRLLDTQLDRGNVEGPGASGADLLDVAVRALGEHTQAGGCNEGLIHPDGFIDLVFISDRAASAPWAEAITALGTLVPDPATVRVHAVVGDGVCADAELGEGYLDAQGTYGGRSAPVCSANTQPFFEDLARANVRWHDRMVLSQPAVQWRMEVAVNGTVWDQGWAYDVDTTSVIFDQVRPERGADVVVDYAVLGECNEG